MAGIITTIGQFLKLNELTESHRTASVAWDKFHRSIRIELIKAPDERPDVNYFMKTSRDEFDRLMETCPDIDKNIIELFRKKLTTGIDKNDVIRKNKNFNKLIKPELFNEISSLQDVVYKQIKVNTIEITEKNRIEKLLIEREDYKNKSKNVWSFIETFKAKYGREPSEDEMYSNLRNIDLTPSELKIIIEQH